MYLEPNLIMTVLFIAICIGALQGICGYLTLLERKIAAWTQDRIGPNRVGPLGLLQPLCDGIKFILKEEMIPDRVDKLFFVIAPGIALATATIAFAVVPFGETTVPPKLVDYRATMAAYKLDPSKAAELANEARKDNRSIWPQTDAEMQALLAADEEYVKAFGGKTYAEELKDYNAQIQFAIAPHIDVGLVFVFAIGSLAVYSVILGGWSSNNKYSFIGALRSSAQLISYEIPLGMAVLGVLAMTGSLNLERIIHHQYEHGWNFLFQPLAALLFVVSVFAECNRVPFDLPECEQELVGGYHTEYSQMNFGFYMLGEYTHMITTSFIVSILFFGGWLLPGVVEPGDAGVKTMILKLVVLCGKMGLFIVFFMLVRWTIPRFRFDQLMALAWKVLMPLALASIVCVLLVKYFKLDPWVMLPMSIVILIGTAWFTIFMPRNQSKVSLNVRGTGTPNPLSVR